MKQATEVNKSSKSKAGGSEEALQCMTVKHDFFFHPDCFFKAVFRGTSVKEYNWDGEKTLTNSSFQVP